MSIDRKQEDRLRRRRKLSTRIAMDTARRIILFFIVPITSIILFVLFVVSDLIDLTVNSTSWFIVSFFLLVGGWASLTTMWRSTLHVLDRIEEKHASGLKDVTEIIDARLRPEILTLRSKDEVRTAAARLLEAVLEQNTDQIVFYAGGANLRSTPEEEAEALESGQDPQTHPGIRFKQAFNDLLVPTSKAEVVRYLRLFTETEFKGRSPQFREAHLKWLASEVARVADHKGFVVMRSERAPAWGASRSTLITEDAVLEIVGDGHAAVLIKGGDIARLLRTSTESYFRSAPRNKPASFTRENVPQFRKLYEELKKIHEQELEKSRTTRGRLDKKEQSLGIS